jgi:hypothetical protein
MLPSEHDEGNRDANSKNQKVSSAIKVYDTDDRDEAKQIVREGGFISPTRGYVVVQGAKDTESGGTIGVVPENI